MLANGGCVGVAKASLQLAKIYQLISIWRPENMAKLSASAKINTAGNQRRQ
jgi:hypothetical protein